MRLVLLAVALLSASPALARITPEHFKGMLLAADGETPPVPVEALSRPELEAELKRLDAQRPSIGGPIAMLSVGGGMIVLGGLIALSGIGYGSGIVAALGIGIFLGGAAFVTVGMILLFTRIAARQPLDARMGDIRARLETLDGGDAPPPPPPADGLPPPPPPPPPGAERNGPTPSLLLAEF